jgi:hypothetical protein
VFNTELPHFSAHYLRCVYVSLITAHDDVGSPRPGAVQARRVFLSERRAVSTYGNVDLARRLSDWHVLTLVGRDLLDVTVPHRTVKITNISKE